MRHLNEVVDLLCRLDTKTITEAIDSNDLDVLRVDDGKLLSPHQLELFKSSGQEHWLEASEVLRERANRAQTEAWAADRSLELLKKYGFTDDGSIVADVLPHMSAADLAEWRSLVQIMQDSDKD